MSGICGSVESGAGGYGHAVHGISALVEAGISVTVNVSLHDRVLGQANLLARDLNSLGLASVSVTSPIMQGRLPESLDAFGKINRRTAEDFANTMAVLMTAP